MEDKKKFSGSGDEGEFRSFAIGNEAGIEVFELGMVTGGTEGAEVEDATDLGTTAADVALTTEGSAVVIARGESGEACDL